METAYETTAAFVGKPAHELHEQLYMSYILTTVNGYPRSRCGDAGSILPFDRARSVG